MSNHSARQVSRRGFVVGGGLAAAGAAAAVSGLGVALADEAAEEAVAETAAEEMPAGAGAAQGSAHVYQVISDELNPQDRDYRQNSGDLSHVLSPWKLGNSEIARRIVKSAAGSNYENGGWDAFVEYYRRLAAGGTEMIWVENFCHIFTPYTCSINANIDEFTDEQVKQLVDAIHAEGAKCGTQSDMMGSTFMSEIVTAGGGTYDCQYMTEENIEFMIEKYVEAGKKLKEWGFDAWELNCAGNNMTQWFFSRARNHREDDYGAQTYENRTRFITRVIQSVHEAVGEDWPIQILMNGIEENDVNIGDSAEFNTVADGVEIAKMLEAAGAASLHVRIGPLEQHATQFLADLFFDPLGCMGSTSFGTQFDFSRHFEGKLIANHDGCGIMLDVAKEYCDAVNIPVGTVTYLDPAHAPDFTDQAIADGKVDFLMINRPLTVDNEYVNKLKEGRFDEIRPCTRCCHCWNDSFREDPSPLSSQFGGMNYSCRLDPVRDFVGQDRGLPGGFDPDPGDGEKNVMVVGGGPAGMEAARIAAQRGYTVTLYEKQGYLGGLMNFMSAIKGPHQNLADYIAWSERDLELKGVTVVTGQEVDAAFIKEQAPDVVILAVGGKRDALVAEGDEATNVISIDDVASAEIGQRVTIIGGNAQATDVALYLLAQGKHVNIVMSDTIDLLSKGQSIWCRKFSIPMLYARGTRVYPGAELLGIADGQITVKKDSGAEVSWACDTVIDARDMLTNEDMLAELEGMDAHVVGDATDPWNIQYAIRSGNWCARTI